MKGIVREYLLSCGIALASVALVGAVASIPRFSVVSIPLAPGMLLAAVFFAQGGESDFASAYVVLALLIDTLIYGWPVLWLMRVIKQRRAAAKDVEGI